MSASGSPRSSPRAIRLWPADRGSPPRRGGTGASGRGPPPRRRRRHRTRRSASPPFRWSPRIGFVGSATRRARRPHAGRGPPLDRGAPAASAAAGSKSQKAIATFRERSPHFFAIASSDGAEPVGEHPGASAATTEGIPAKSWDRMTPRIRKQRKRPGLGRDAAARSPSPPVVAPAGSSSSASIRRAVAAPRSPPSGSSPRNVKHSRARHQECGRQRRDPPIVAFVELAAVVERERMRRIPFRGIGERARERVAVARELVVHRQHLEAAWLVSGAQRRERRASRRAARAGRALHVDQHHLSGEIGKTNETGGANGGELEGGRAFLRAEGAAAARAAAASVRSMGPPETVSSARGARFEARRAGRPLRKSFGPGADLLGKLIVGGVLAVALRYAPLDPPPRSCQESLAPGREALSQRPASPAP